MNPRFWPRPESCEIAVGMKLLYVNYGPQSGVTPSLARELALRGVDVTAYNPVASFLYSRRVGPFLVPNARPEVARAVAAALLRHGRHWEEYYLHTTYAFDQLSRKVSEQARRARPDVLLQAGVLFGPGEVQVPYALYLDNTKALAERYRPISGVPPAPPFDADWRWREKKVYEGAAAIFTMSRHTARSLEEDYRIDRSRIHVVGAGPNVVPPGANPAGAREKLFVFVGRDLRAKGGLVLLRAFEHVRTRHPDARLIVVSRERCAPAPAGVAFTGLLPQAEIARLYASACAFVLPTLREPFGLVFLEAASFGLPAIGTRLSAVPEIIAEGETGLLVEPEDEIDLARAMVRLLDDPRRAAAMGVRARARVLERYGWDRVADRMLAVLASVVPEIALSKTA